MRAATRQSEEVQLEEAMLTDKLRETDWELTQEALQEQAARESYLSWLRDNEKRRNNSNVSVWVNNTKMSVLGNDPNVSL